MFGQWMGDNRIIINQGTQSDKCPMCGRKLEDK